MKFLAPAAEARMASDFEVGRVVAVDTAQVTIELARDLKALTRNTYQGSYEVGQINSYVVIPVGARRLVAIITRVVLAEEAELAPDRTMVTLPIARRLMKATLVGTIDGTSYSQGVTVFPVLDNPVQMVSEDDLDTIFDHGVEDSVVRDPTKPGFSVHLGESPIFTGYPVKIDPDAFFGKHAAVLGSTGAGKSCTIASLVQSILAREDVRRTNIVILDTNGEYQSAFAGSTEPASSCLYIPSDPTRRSERLVVPYWFMNAEDFIRLFRAREGLQAPVLLRALRGARSAEIEAGNGPRTLEVLRTTCNVIRGLTEIEGNARYHAPRNIREHCDQALAFREQFEADVEALDEYCGAGTYAAYEHGISEIRGVVEEVWPSTSASPTGQFGPIAVQRIRQALDPLLARLSGVHSTATDGSGNVSADWPVFFDRTAFVGTGLDAAMREQAEAGSPGRIREACGPMRLRVQRFVEDPRFEFLFGDFPNAEHALAAFLRDILGLPAAQSPQPALSDGISVPAEVLPYYDRQREDTPGHNVVVVDLSLLAAEVLENVTALIGRLILEFLQWLGEEDGGEARGSLPVVLVLEEAQNYVREQRFGEEESIARAVFERIAREGRKFALGLVVASQRPSELSKTVLSQCNSFIVHRLQNPEDLRYFKEIVPATYGALLDQLPALTPRTALVLGECVKAPALVRIREARPLPRSRDPRFFQHWTADQPTPVPVETVAGRWERRATREQAVPPAIPAEDETGPPSE